MQKRIKVTGETKGVTFLAMVSIISQNFHYPDFSSAPSLFSFFDRQRKQDLKNSSPEVHSFSHRVQKIENRKGHTLTKTTVGSRKKSFPK